jgi:hypothetical protein
MGKYIGSQAPVGILRKQQLAPNGVLTTFALNFKASDANSLLVVKAGVVQEPGAGKDYTIAAAGTQVVFAVAPAAVSLYILFLGTELTVPTNSGSSFPGAVDIGGQLNLNGPLYITGVTPLIATNTTDGSDNKLIDIQAGGAAGPTRGAGVTVHGNEHATSAGKVIISGGNVAGANIEFNAGAGLRRWFIDTSGGLNQDPTNGSDIIFGNATPYIRTTSQTSSVTILGGSANDAVGGAISAFGGSHGSAPGDVRIGTGNASGNIRLRLRGTARNLLITDNSDLAIWTFGGDGIITQDATRGGDIVISKAASGIRAATNALQVTYGGGAAFGSANGSAIIVEGNDYGGAGLGGNVTINTGYATGGGGGFQINVRDASAARRRWYMTYNSGNLFSDVSYGGNIILNKPGSSYETYGTNSSGVILRNSDANQANLSGVSVTYLANNQTGNAQIKFADDVGNNNNAIISFLTSNAGTIRNRWSINSSGNFTQDASYGSDIVFSNADGFIRQSTSDAADNKSIIFAGGGSSSNGRGSSIGVYGNEYASVGGSVAIVGGGVSTGHINLTTNNSGANIDLRTNALSRWTINGSTGALTQNATNGGPIVFGKNDNVSNGIMADTADAADSKNFFITAGGAFSNTGSRGALVQVSGNEATGGVAGLLALYAGNAANGTIQFRTGAGLLRWEIGTTGNLIQDATNGGPIVMSKTGTNLITLGVSTLDADTNYSHITSVSNTTASAQNAFFIGNNANTTGGTLQLGKTRGTGSDANTVVVSGDTLGQIDFRGADGAAYLQGAFIRAVVDGTPGTNDMPTRIEFGTTIDAGLSSNRKWYIDNSGGFQQDTTNGNDFTFNRTGTGLRFNSIGGFVSTSGTNAFTVYTNALARWAFNGSTGDFESDATNGGGIILKKTGANLTPIISGAATVDADLTALTSTHYGLLINQNRTISDSIVCVANAANTLAGIITFAKTRATGPGTDANTIVVNGDELGALRFLGADGASYQQAALIVAKVDGSPGVADMPGRLEFHTTPDGSNSAARRWFISSAGHLTQDSTNGGDLIFGKTTMSIYGTSGDGSDNQTLVLNPTGQSFPTTNRGAGISLSGNEAGDLGTVKINTGDTTNCTFDNKLGGSASKYRITDNSDTLLFAVQVGGKIEVMKTVTAGGTTGAQTINKSLGTVNFAAAATSLVVTNNLVSTSSIVIATVRTNDTTLKSVQAVSGAGSFTLYGNAAATAETSVGFIVYN